MTNRLIKEKQNERTKSIKRSEDYTVIVVVHKFEMHHTLYHNIYSVSYVDLKLLFLQNNIV